MPDQAMSPAEAIRLLLLDYDDKAPCSAKISIAGCQSCIVGDTCIIRGSNEWADWARYNFLAVPWPGDNYWWHKGFLNHARVAYAFAKDKGVKRVIGHSLGAAAAGIVACSLGVEGMGFATPRALWSRSSPPNQVTNWCRTDDTVCYVPLGCRHLGRVNWLDPNPGDPRGAQHALAFYLELLEQKAKAVAK